MKLGTTFDRKTIENDATFAPKCSPSARNSVGAFGAREQRHLDLDVVHQCWLHVAEVVDDILRDFRETGVSAARADGGNASNIGTELTTVPISGCA
jgi:hypothetical protein